MGGVGWLALSTSVQKQKLWTQMVSRAGASQAQASAAQALCATMETPATFPALSGSQGCASFVGITLTVVLAQGVQGLSCPGSRQRSEYVRGIAQGRDFQGQKEQTYPFLPP